MPAPRKRPWLLAVVLLLLVAVALAPLRASSGAGSAAAPPASSDGLARAGFGLLGAAARDSVSDALGADSAAYHARASVGGFQERSPAQALNARFGPSGVELSSHAVRLGLSLRAIGDGFSLRALAPVAPTASGNRVSYARTGLTEWYANGPAGIEQGFTVARAPFADAHQLLTLSLAVATDAHARLAGDRRSVSFAGAHGGSLRYGALSATDARGRTLPAGIALEHGTLLLRIDTRGARYPLRVDPLVEQGGKLTGSGASGEVPPQFGISTALSADGSTALIAGTADGNFRGAVWVFTRSGDEWIQQAKLTGANEGEPAQEQCAEEPGETEDCTFGSSVAISADGNSALIGDPSASSRHGTALVFSRSGSSWKQAATLAGSNETDEGRFGKSVALSADGATALVGDPSGEGGHGVAWVFSGSGSVWSTPGQRIWPKAESSMPHVGRSVALSADGNTALIGAPGGVGSARVFARVGSTWTPEGEPLVAQNEIGEARFGRTVALSGDGATALVAGPSDDGGLGAVWVFTRSGSAFTLQSGKLIGSRASGEAHFGYSAAISSDGDTALIGAPREHTGAGAVSVLERSGSTWTELGEGLAGAEASGRGFSGAAVALSGDGETALIGAPRDAGRTGAAWAFAFEEASALTRAPVVANVQPGAGPISGGSNVTISGANFTDASAVMFGATPAASFTVESATTITAVTPPEPRGLVHVTVTTPAGTSAEGEDDQFRFEGKGEPEPAPPAGSSDPPPQSASGGVLGFTATSASSSACTVSLRNKHLAVRLQSIAALRLLRTGTGSCRGTLALLHKTKTKGKRYKMQTIGTSSFSIAAGQSEVVKIKLNKLGRTLFRTHHGRLNVSLSIVRRTPTPVFGRTASVRLTWKKTPRSRPTAK